MDRLIYKRGLHHTSTGVANPVVQVDVDIKPSTFCAVAVLDSNTWQEVKFDQSLVSQMQESMSIHPQANERAQIQSSSIPDFPESLELSESHKPMEFQLPLQARRQTGKATFTSTLPVRTDIREVISSAVAKHGGYTKFDYFVRRKFSLYLRDAGGQVEFQEMVSLLIVGPSIFFFIFRADQDLKSTFPVGYRTSATEAINSYTSSITTEEALLQCLSSVYAMDTSTQADHHTLHPHVFIVATHKDKLGPSADQKICQLNKDIKALIEESGFESLVQYADRAKGQVMFAVDNTSESDDDFKPIRSQVHDLIVSRKEFTVEYPFSYLLFCLELQGDQRSVLTFEECRAIAAKYKIVGDKVSDLLYFLHHRIGIIHFIDIKGVRCIAMKRPEDLFNKVTDLVVKTFSCNTLTMEEAGDFEKKGILTASAFESVVSSKDAITADEFLKILVHLRIVAEFTKPGEQEKRYFIPCVLNHVSKSTEEESTTSIMPLAVKFKCKHCPKGLFGVLVTHLMTNKEESGLSFALREDKIFKDQVSFYVESSSDPNEMDEVSLKLHPRHLQISFFPDECEDRDRSVGSVCNEVREQIYQYLLSSLKHLHYNQVKVEPVICIECVECCQLHEVRKNCRVFCEKVDKTINVAKAKCWWNKGQCS